MTEQPAEDAWADVDDVQEPADAPANGEDEHEPADAPANGEDEHEPEDTRAEEGTNLDPGDDSTPTPAVVELSGETENTSDAEPPEVAGFQLTTADVVALVNDRSEEKMSVSTFRTLVAQGQAPQPLNWGRTPLWSFSTVEDWIAKMFASGAFTTPSVTSDATEEEQADQAEVEGFQLTTADVVALVNDRSEEKMSVSTFRTLVAQGQAPQPLNWGRTPLWSFSTVEDWIAKMFASGAFTVPVVMLEVAEAEQAAQQEPELVFGSTAQWVEEFLVPMYRRDIAPNGAGTLTWCPQWWEHAEAIIRLEALWRAWEHLRLDGKTGMSVFMKDHLDHHMPTLMDGQGPFDGCSLAKGHVGQMKPVTLVPAPPELFPDARQQVTNTKES